MVDSPTPSAISDVPDPALRQLRWLRFPAELEVEFLRDYEAGAPASRAILQFAAIVLMAITPLYDGPLLHAPAEFLKISHLLQFGVQIPAVLLALAITVTPRLRSASRSATLIAVVFCALSLSAQRMVGAKMGFDVPQDFAAVTISSTFFAARMPVRTFWPIAALIMAATTILGLIANSDPLSLYGAISTWMLFFLAVVGAALLEYTMRESWYRGRLLEHMASRDALTGLPNRRFFDLELRLLLRAAVRERRPVALLILDIDHFKAFNDHYGHPLGDECLRRIGACLRDGMRRPRDFCARIGGEEFAAIWYDADPAFAARLAEQLRQSIDSLAMPPAPGCGETVTASAGFAQLVQPAAGADTEQLAETLIHEADDALYRAKHNGRARLVTAGVTRRAA